MALDLRKSKLSSRSIRLRLPNAIKGFQYYGDGSGDFRVIHNT